MEFTVTAQGPTFAQLTTRTARAMRTANRTAGREIAKLGKKAMGDAAKAQGRRWYGKPLRVKFKVQSSPTDAEVTFNPAKGQAGAWAIAEAGASAHTIRPRRRGGGRALRFGDEYAAVARHPGARGVGTWTRATKAIDKVVRPELVDIYDEALAA